MHSFGLESSSWDRGTAVSLWAPGAQKWGTPNTKPCGAVELPQKRSSGITFLFHGSSTAASVPTTNLSQPGAKQLGALCSGSVSRRASQSEARDRSPLLFGRTAPRGPFPREKGS